MVGQKRLTLDEMSNELELMAGRCRTKEGDSTTYLYLEAQQAQALRDAARTIRLFENYGGAAWLKGKIEKSTQRRKGRA